MSAPLHVIQVAYPFEPVRPDTAGGAEQVLAALDAALVRRGHRSTVVARKGSEVAGRLVSVSIPRGRITPAARAAGHATVRRVVARCIEELRPDLVHLHGVDYASYLPPIGTPTLVTLHLPPDFYPPEIVRRPRPDVHLCCVSHTQRRAWPGSGRFVGPVRNGVALEQFEPRRDKLGYALTLGRVCPEKGYHLAMDAARWAGIPLIVAGVVHPYASHERYYRDEIRPREGPGCHFVGSVGPRSRRRLLSRARCLLVPSLVDETSCLVAMEALASATPVVAFHRGALGEVIEDGRTGFLVRDVEGMVTALRRLGEIDPGACRRAAEARCAGDRMHEDYFALYRQLASRRTRLGSGRGA